MNTESILKQLRVKVWPDVYSVVKARYIPRHYVAVVKDFNETTVITETYNVPADCVIKEETDWKILTFDLELPFELIGFLSLIAKNMADAKIPIFVLSSFSTDHILVKSKKLEKAIEVLRDLGCYIDL